ncbi:uncharacterized protein LOC6531752 isoform X2 [Drosophila yakuba]|uniref:uncharacterized protein LOC6531752 isoform X2 n=1 Tax=Drosophila yakuba TaxID=7245 RepID=UPI0019307C59|nr:uncharacterized protein LOC6531752 isoform X2 [Drosophila yakuba]
MLLTRWQHAASVHSRHSLDTWRSDISSAPLANAVASAIVIPIRWPSGAAASGVQYATVTRSANNTARLLRSGPLHRLDPEPDLDLQIDLQLDRYTAQPPNRQTAKPPYRHTARRTVRCSCHSKARRSAASDKKAPISYHSIPKATH